MKNLLPFTFVALLALTAASKDPNIIYILADDLGYGDLSCLGQTKFQTPNIDSLARDGMIFTQHYSGSTVCAPSRCALLTGRHTGHCFVRGNAEVMPEGQSSMPAATYTIGHMLKKKGYVTGVFGKWGLGAPGSDSEPLKMGFDRFYGYNCQRQAHHYYPYFLWNDNQREMLWGNFGLETGDYAPDLIQQQALKFIADNRDKSFFLYYAMVQPHAEMIAPDSYMKKYRNKFLPEKAYEGTDDGPNFRKGPYCSQPDSHAAFAAMINVLDDDIGELRILLKKLGIDKDTIIMFTSDNGPHVEGGADPEYFNSSGGRRGVKRDLYEGGIHVPMIACWPGKIKPGTKTEHISAFWDVMPTLADIAAVEPPGEIDGISFLPTLMNYPGQKQHDYLYWEFHSYKGRQAMRQGKWKAVRYNVADNPDAPVELYDLTADPSEKDNIAAQHPEVATKMAKLIKEARIPSHTPKFNFPAPKN